jgi:hypothetical protein
VRLIFGGQLNAQISVGGVVAAAGIAGLVGIADLAATIFIQGPTGRSDPAEKL